jgi:hypothetical protein
MLTYDPLYLKFGHQNVFKSKNNQYKHFLEFQNLHLYYIVKFQIRNASKKILNTKFLKFQNLKFCYVTKL